MAADAEADVRTRQLLAEDVRSVQDVKELLEKSRQKASDQRRLLDDFTSGRFNDAYRRVHWATNPSWPSLLALMGSESHMRAA